MADYYFMTFPHALVLWLQNRPRPTPHSMTHSAWSESGGVMPSARNFALGVISGAETFAMKRQNVKICKNPMTLIFSKLVNLVHLFWRFWKALGKRYKSPKILWAKVQKRKLLGDQILKFRPIFSKLVNFGPHSLSLLESPCEELKDTQSLWAKIQKQSIGGLNFDDDSDFLKIGGLWSTFLTLLESPREGLQALKILCSKVH